MHDLCQSLCLQVSFFFFSFQTVTAINRDHLYSKHTSPPYEIAEVTHIEKKIPASNVCAAEQPLFWSRCSARREQVISALSKSKRPFPLVKRGQMH